MNFKLIKKKPKVHQTTHPPPVIYRGKHIIEFHDAVILQTKNNNINIDMYTKKPGENF